MRALSLIETRVFGTLYEKQHTVPDSYPLTLNALVSGANQKTSRSPVMEVTESEVQAALLPQRGARIAGAFVVGRDPDRADAARAADRWRAAHQLRATE
jgi:uncharacterized protein YceH (UPF0502 family)